MLNRQVKNMSKKKSQSKNKIAVLLLILLLPSLVYFILSKSKHHFIEVPIFYATGEVKDTIINGKKRIDSVYHTIPNFKFINQRRDTVTEKNYKGKIYVTDFFFATCQTTCLKMTTQMHRLQEEFKNNNDVMFLSHTVNPMQDSAEVLALYAKKVQADSSRWNFVTGEKEKIYEQARKGFFLPAEVGNGGPNDFIHSNMLVLVDKEKRIRGYYDGTTFSEVNKLIDDIKMLLADYERRNPTEKNKITKGEPQHE